MISSALILLLPAFTFLLNHSVIQGAIIQWLNTEAGIEVAAVRVHLFPRLKVEFSEMVVRDDRHTDTILRTRHGSFTVRLLPLLKRRLAIVQATVEEPHVVIRRDREGGWRIPFVREVQSPQSRREGGFKWQWLLPDLQLTGGEIRLVDEGWESPREVRIKNVTGSVDSDVLRTEADVSLTGNIDEGAIELSGSLMLTRSVSSSLPSLDAAPPLRFEGSIHLDQFDLASWLDLSDDMVSGDGSSRRVDVSAQALILAGPAGFDATLSRLETRFDWLVVRGQGRILTLGTQHPIYSATLSTSPVGLETLLQRIPAVWIPPKIRSAFENHDLAGTLELVSATLGGRLDRLEHSDWKGVVRLSAGRGVFGAERVPIQRLSGTVFFDPMHIEVMDLSGGVGTLQLSDGKLVLSHLQVVPALDLQLTGAGKMKEFLTLLHPFSESNAGVTLLNAIMEPKGDVRLSIHVAGPLTPTPHIDLVRAEIAGHDLGARIPDWNLSVEHLDGSVGVTPHFIELRRLRGTLGPIYFNVAGAVEMGATPRFEDVTVEVSSEGAELRKFLAARSSVPSEVVFDGPSYATIRLSGPVSSPRWKGSIDLTGAEIAVPPVIMKHRGVASSLEFDGSTRDERLLARHLAFRLPLARVEGHAEVRLRKRPEFSVHLNMGPLPLGRLADGFSIESGTEGVFQASITITGRGLSWESWTPTGFVHLRKGAIPVDGLRDRLRRISLRLQVAGQDAMIERLSFRIGDSDITVQGIIKDWASHPMPRLTLESSKLDVTRLIPTSGSPHERGDMFDRIHQWALAGRAEVTAIIKQAQYRRLVFRTLSGHLRIGAGKIKLEHVIGETPEGNLSGRIIATLTSQKPIEIESQLKIDGMPVNQLISVIDPEAEPLRGLLSLTGGMRGRMANSVPFLGTLNTLDPLELRLENGRVLHGTVLPKVLKILNVPALLKDEVDLDRDGIPFDSVSATLAIQKGIVTSEDIVFDSPVMKVSGAGTLDILADELDLALAVSPLGAYSNLIGTIPLFGHLLAGDRPGLSTALFEVTGSRRDPDIRYLPIESIAKGLTGYPRLAIDVLLNTITLPQKLMTPATP